MKIKETVYQIEMTPERKALYAGVAAEVILLLQRDLGPEDAFIVLNMCRDHMTEYYGLVDSRMLPETEKT